MATSLYWHDIDDRQGHWAGLEVTVGPSSSPRPPLHLLTGHNGRMRLMLNGSPLFWATSERWYYGAWVVRRSLPSQLDFAPIAPIRSNEVARYAALAPIERIKAWSRFFVLRLRESSSGLLCPGRWLTQGLLPVAAKSHGVTQQGPAAWYFSSGAGRDVHLPNWALSGEEMLNSLQSQPVRWLDGFRWYEKLIALRHVDLRADRLKWWRKKAREGSLPPILVWHIAGLSSYVIIDGHYRLQAAIDENSAPSFIVISASRVQEISPCPEHQQRMVDLLLIQRARNPKFDIDTFNRLLIDTFDNRPHLSASTYSWAGIRSEQEWVTEVTQHLAGLGSTQYLQQILERSE